MEMKLLKPWDRISPELDTEEVGRLKDRNEFDSELEWTVYQAKVFYEGFGDPKPAVDILEEALKKHPSNSDLMFCLAECLSRNSSTLESALEYCDKGLDLNNESDYGHTIKARIHLTKEDPIQAYISAMNALKINSRNFEAGVYLGVTGFAIAATEGNIEEMEYSVKNLKTTLSLNPTSENLARIIAENEKYLHQVKGGNENE